MRTGALGHPGGQWCPRKKTRVAVLGISSLRRPLPLGNLSEVFKVREAELTATLSNRRSDTQSPVEERSKGRTASKSANTLQEITNEDAASVEEEEEGRLGGMGVSFFDL